MPVPAPAVAEEAIRYISAATSRRADQTIEAIDAATAENGAASERRREPREFCRGQVSVKLAIRTTSIVAGGETQNVCVEVFARNLSKSGFGFLAAPMYLPEDRCGGIALRGEDVFQAGKLVKIAIVRAEGRPRWMPARVLRARVVDGGFVECGVEFV